MSGQIDTRRWRRRLALAMLMPVACCPSRALAHGFGQRYDLPVPLALWIAGAGATIVLSFVVAALLLRPSRLWADYPRLNLLAIPATRWLAHPAVLAIPRLAAVVAFVATIVAGFVGTPDAFRNLAPVMVWVIWWVGLAFVCALAGDLWALVNPLRTLFLWAERLHARVTGGRPLSRGWRYPRAIGSWPAVAGLLIFAWAELVWPDGDVPFMLALCITSYALYTWIGMFLFGREVWLQSAETFTVAFGVLSRFAPLEVRVVDVAAVAACPGPRCRQHGYDCVNGYVCLDASRAEAPQWNLRPHGVGLLNDRRVAVSLMVFIVTMLSTVTFDGILETQFWLDRLNGFLSSPWSAPLLSLLRDSGIDEAQVFMIITLLAVPSLFLAVFLTCSWLMSRAARGFSSDPAPAAAHGALDVACTFILTLVPIAIAYHLAHYLSMLLISGQFLIPLASDPFGYGWNLLGTADFKVDIAITGARFIWYTAVTAIVVGHVFAVYLAHVVALRLYGNSRRALLSQVPMVTLMVLYTMVSLWILAQPIVA